VTLPPKTAPLPARIDAAIAYLEEDHCFRDAADVASCDWADYDIVGPATFAMARSTGEAILVIDDLRGYANELLRYRNRILAYYTVESDHFAATPLSVHYPRREGDVITYFAGPDFIPAHALARVGKTARETHGRAQLGASGHGGIVFGHLVDLVPEQPLVLADDAQLFALPPEVCAGVSAQTVASARTRFAALAASLRRLMAAHNVRYVNASFGTTIETVKADWQSRCDSALPPVDELRQLLHAYDPLYDTLFNTDGVIAAHAAANLGDSADYPFDQSLPPFANQVRVGYFSSLNSGLDADGRGNLASRGQDPAALGDADVFFNWGCDGSGACAERHYEASGNLGNGTLPLMWTSFIAPLSVGKVVNIRNSRYADQPLSNELIARIKSDIAPRRCGVAQDEPCRYQDPIAHGQLETYRLGYF
jgi:hypothetical protein